MHPRDLARSGMAYDEKLAGRIIDDQATEIEQLQQALKDECERCAKIAENPGFIQARDSEWDDGVNFAKAFIADAIRKSPIMKTSWPDPTPEMLNTPEFNAVWERIKSWDINVPDVYSGYCGATGNHVRAILDALKNTHC